MFELEYCKECGIRLGANGECTDDICVDPEGNKPQWHYGRKMPVTAHYTDDGGTEIEVPLVLLEEPPNEPHPSQLLDTIKQLRKQIEYLEAQAEGYYRGFNLKGSE